MEAKEKMSFRDLALSRRSIREFKPLEIEDKEIMELLETAILSPSAGNLQSWEFLLVKDKRNKEEIAKIAFDQRFIAKASHLIIVFANKKRSSSKYGKRGEFYSIIDAS
ncbi:MAG: nitroreductase family protein, partial [Candidatus Micrarchaeota archaeon]|nr:nitroreductase family protein [Candidatus Micrarchaeota archaeon]